MLLFDRNIVLFSFMTIVLGVILGLSRVPLKRVVRGTMGMFLILCVLSFLNAFTTYGNVIFSMGGLEITKEGLVKSGFVLWRMVLMIVCASLLMYTTTPSQLTDGLEKGFHINGDVAMSITIGMRFISVIFDELRLIMKAQEARGASLHKGSIARRARSLKSIVVPVFQNAIDRAAKLGEAMDARCYTGGEGRTKLRPLVYKRNDYIGYVCMLLMIALDIALVIYF